jgi:hypothetical protein
MRQHLYCITNDKIWISIAAGKAGICVQSLRNASYYVLSTIHISFRFSCQTQQTPNNSLTFHCA